jgi:PAS domain S-box-containing protein
MNLLDIRTIIFTYAISNAVCLAVIASLWRRNRKRLAGLGFWLADYAMQFTVILLVALRGVVPDFASIVVSNSLVVAGTILLYMGLERFVGKPTSQVYNYFLLAVFVSIHWYFAFVQPSLLIRTINLSTGLILICSQCAWLLIRRAETEMRPITRGVGYVFIAFSLFSIARIVVDLVMDPGNDFFQSGIYEALAVLTNQTLFIVLTFSLLLLVNRRLVADLERDIVEREQAEEALHDSEGRFRSLFENMLSGYAYCKMIYDAGQPQDFVYLEVNSAFAALTGLKDVLGKRVTEVIPGIRESNPELFEIYGRVAMTSEPEKFETYVDALGIWFSISVYCPRPEHFVAVFENITERKQAEEEIESLSRFPTENPNPILRVQNDGRLSYANEASQDLLESWGCEVGGHLPAALEEQVDAAAITGSGTTVDVPCNDKVYSLMLVPIPESGYVNLYGRDITARLRIEQALSESEEKYRLIADHSNDWIYLTNPDRSFRYVSPSCERITGYTSQEFMAAPGLSIDIVHPEDRARVEAHSEEMRKENEAENLEFRIITKAGEARWISHICAPVYTAGGEYIGRRGTNRDITERKNAEEALRQTAEELDKRTRELNAILSSVQEFVYIFDPKGRFVFANKKLLDLWGLNAGQAIGKTMHDLEYPETVETALLEAAQRVLETGQTVTNITHYTSPTGATGSYENILAPMLDAGGKVAFVAGSSRDITERKRAEELLRENEARLRQALSAAKSGTWEWNLETNKNVWSEELWEVYGLEPYSVEPSYDAWLATIHPDDRMRAAQTVQEAAKNETELNTEWRVIDKDGTERWLMSRGQPLKDSNGRAVRYIGTVLDITERKQAEVALKESEERFSTAFFTSPVAQSIITQGSNEIIAVNDACCHLFEYRREELIGAKTAKLNLWENPDDRLVAMEELQRTGRLLSREATIRVKSGEIRTVITAIEPISWKGLPCFISSVFDITERKQAEEALRESEERLRQIASSLREVIWLRDVQTRQVLYVNPAFEELTGRTCESFFENRDIMIDAIHPDDREEVVKGLEQRLEGVPFDKEHRIIHQNGSVRWVLSRIFPVRNEAGEVYRWASIMEDITERKRAETELHRTMEDLRYSNAELEQFAYVASHDLQEPLRGIAGLTQLLGQKYQGKLDSRADEYITHIIEGTQRMQTLINDLLAYSRVGRRGEAIQTTEAGVALQLALKNLNAAILEYKATITNENLPMVQADATQLVQLFQNLIGNAIKFRSPVRPPQIHIGVTDAGEMWQFSVRDNGIGIEPQYYERIFQVFQRLHTRREYKGTGIGLAICKKIIDRHGGKIWVESQWGEGSTFYFTLPKGN